MTQSATRVPELRRLEQDLDVLKPLVRSPELAKYVRDRLSAICMELFAVIGARANTQRLEAVARAAVDFDFKGLQELIARLVALPEERLEGETRSEAPEARGSLEAARKLIATTEQYLAEIDPMEIGLRFELFVDRALADFLKLLKRDDPELAGIVRSAEAKLSSLDGRERERAWAKIAGELRFDGDDADSWLTRMSVSEGVVSRSFFTDVSPEDLAQRIARYMFDIRPRLVHAAFAAGASSVPMPPLSVTRLLAARPDANAVSFNESRLVAHVMLLAHILGKRLFRSDEEIAGALKIPKDSRLLLGEPEKRARELIPDAGMSQVMIAEIRGATSALSAVIGGVDDPELAMLVRYKRSLEVGLPEARGLLIGKNEVTLQRRLCSFLIQHGAAAVGTRFGRAETDVVTGTDVDPLVIEAKVFRTAPKVRDIEAAFTQLRSYMDQTAHVSRGALVFFNLSDVPIHASREVLGGRIVIVAINLPSVTPSQQEAYVEVRGGPPGGEVLEVLPIGRIGKRQAAKPRPPKRRKGRSR